MSEGRGTTDDDRLVSPGEEGYDDAFDMCPEPTCPLYGKAVMADHRHLTGREAARSTREDRAMRQHRWAYSNTNEAWFCEVCHRQDRSGQDVPDDDPCPGKKEPRDA